MERNTLIDGETSFFRDHRLWSNLTLAGLAVGAIIYALSFLVDLTSRGVDET